MHAYSLKLLLCIRLPPYNLTVISNIPVTPNIQIPLCHGYKGHIPIARYDRIWIDMSCVAFRLRQWKKHSVTLFFSFALGDMETSWWDGWTNRSKWLGMFCYNMEEGCHRDLFGCTLDSEWAKYTWVVLSFWGIGICKYHRIFLPILSDKRGKCKDEGLCTKDGITQLLK